MSLIKSYRPDFDDPAWQTARAALAASNARIAQIDTGLFAHPALGFTAAGAPPANIALADGRNFYDPQISPFGDQPLTDLTRATDPVGKLIEFPDHGVKTMGVILADNAHFTGAAPGVKTIPFRVSNGPVFRRSASDLARNLHATARIGQAIEHALALAHPPCVITMSMGNPGIVPWEFLRLVLNGSIGITKAVAKSIDRAYRRGIPVICAAGQVEHSVLFPAVMKRTIAVAGFERAAGGKLIHYPRGGYNNPGRVDSWALAVGLNRPGGHRGADGKPVATYAENDTQDDKPAGTSYATPFVTAAYAMWFATHRTALTAGVASATNAWRRVEAFRRILRQQMPTVMVGSGQAAEPDIAIRPLDIPRLLKIAPDFDGLEMQPPFRNFAFSNEDQPEDIGLFV